MPNMVVKFGAQVGVCSMSIHHAVYAAFIFGVLSAANAAADPIPAELGSCVQTRIAQLGTRIEGMPDSGDSVTYSNGIYGVSYERVAGLRSSRIGDTVVLCLSSLPQDCPKGDDRGKTYTGVNLRTRHGWMLPDSSHMCGGA